MGSMKKPIWTITTQLITKVWGDEGTKNGVIFPGVTDFSSSLLQKETREDEGDMQR